MRRADRFVVAACALGVAAAIVFWRAPDAEELNEGLAEAEREPIDAA